MESGGVDTPREPALGAAGGDVGGSTGGRGARGSTGRRQGWSIGRLVRQRPSPARYRAALAVAMAVISIAAATLALRTALIASEAAYVDSAALQESVERQRREQFLGLVVDQDSRLFATYAQVFTSRAGHMAELQGATDPGERERLSLEIQAESDLLRAAFPMFQAVRPTVAADGNVVLDAAGTLNQLLATDARLQELRSERSVARAERLHETALLLIADVAILVGALLLLTVAQVWRSRAVAAAAAAAGMGAAIAVLAFAGLSDPDPAVRVALLGAALLFVPLAAAVELLVVRGTTPDRPDEVLRAIDSFEESRSLALAVPTADPAVGDPRRLATPFARRVAILIATATFLAAVTAWLQAAASRSSEVAAGNAQAHAIEAAARTQRDVGAAEARIDRVTRHILAAVSAANARHAAGWYDSRGQTAEAAASRREAARWDALAASDAEAAQIASSEFGPATFGPPAGRDARFPAQYLLESQRAALVEVGLADADNKRSAAWSGQASGYTAALAVLAVALYLLGLSLILPAPGIRRLFVRVAGAAMVVVVAVAVIQVAQPPAGAATRAETERAAAERYAAGDIAVSRAQTDPTRRTELFETARRELEAAIALRDDFGLARLDLATVHIQSGSPQSTGYSTIVADDACEAAIEDLRQAQLLGVDSAFTSWNIGYCTFRLALSRNDAELLGRAEQELAAAAALLPDQAVLHINIGSVRLARGDLEGARAAYRAAVDPTLYANVAERIERSDFDREAIVAAALNELDHLGRWRAELASETDSLKRFFVGATLGADDPAAIDLENVEAEAFGGLLGWRASLPDGGTAPADATISQQWYRLDPASGEWYVLPEISGDASLASPTLHRFFADATRPGGYYNQVTLPGYFAPPQCLDRGSYRIELYVGDEMASASLDLADRPQVGVVDRLLGVAFCRPAEWTTTDAARGHHVAFRSEDGSRGIVALRAHAPFVDAASLPEFVERRLRIEAPLFPGTPITSPQAGAPFNGAWFVPATQSGLNGIAGYMDVGTDTLMTVRAAIDTSGSVVIVGVYGPPEDFATLNEGGLYVMNTLFVFS